MNIKFSGKRPCKETHTREETHIRRSKRARKTSITEASAPLHLLQDIELSTRYSDTL